MLYYASAHHSILARRIYLLTPRTYSCNKGTKHTVIQSLEPSRLLSSDFLNLSNRINRFYRASLQDGQRLDGRLAYSPAGKSEPFPDGTQGFLYWHRDPRLPHTTAQVRFRVTPTADPALFQQGTDVLGHDGVLPWSLHVLQLRLLPHTPVGPLAVQDGLIEPSFLASCNEVNFMGLSILTFLEQPFVIRPGKKFVVYVVTPTLRIHRTEVTIPLLRGFKGNVMVHFERATLVEHTNDTSIVMRIDKVLPEPNQQLDESQRPTAGSLIKHHQSSRCREFDPTVLSLLPSIQTAPSPPPPVEKETRTTLTPHVPETFYTLDPHRLQPSDFKTFPGVTNKMFYYHSDAGPGAAPVPVPATITYAGRLPFPANVQGFMYLHSPPLLPPLFAQIRFHITPSHDPAHFHLGTDLLDPQGQPWNISIQQLVQGAQIYAGLRECLKKDGPEPLRKLLENDKLMTAVADPKVFKRTSVVLCYLEQPFEVNMASGMNNFTVVIGDQVHTFVLHLLFQDFAKSDKPTYTGEHPTLSTCS
ncbi:hypothetical protein C0991_003638 [Blastosporella zonata]|nr:hypothetical protein C0991_003638 [Blastosporella zonata]